MLLAGTIFLSPAQAQNSTPGTQQATQDSSTPTKPADKAAPDAKPAAKAPAKKSTTAKTSQANDASKASSSDSAPAASTKQSATASGQTGATPAGQAGTTKTPQAGATKTGSATSKTGKPGASKTAMAKTAVPLTLKTDKDKQSYAIGINVGKGLGQNLKQSGLEIDPAVLTRAIKDVLAGDKQSMTDQEAQETLKTLQADLKKEQQLKQEQAATTNKKEGDDFLAANKAKEGVTTLPDGLQYKILQEGTGPKPAATDEVTVNYRGTLVNGTEFDSSYKRNQPATFNLNGIIKGWTEALQLMPVGSKWQLFIPSDLAYGPSGRPPVIGPNSTLVFEVELVSVQPKPAAPAAPVPNRPPTAAAPNAPAGNPAPTANQPAPAPKPAPPTPPTAKSDPAPVPNPAPKPPTP